MDHQASNKRRSRRKVGPFRFRSSGKQVVVTNDGGSFVFVTPAQLEELVSGRIPADPAKAAELVKKGFVQEQHGPPDTVERRFRKRNEHLFWGPSLHILIVTLRCNQTCVYCQASRRPVGDDGYDMDEQTARRAVDVMFQSPAPSLTIEFQGGEPLMRFDLVKLVVDYARKKSRQSGKEVFFTLVSNLALMNDEILEYVIDQGIQVCTSLDGPADLHDSNRPCRTESSHRAAVHWMEKMNRAYEQRGMDTDLAHVNALLTVTRQTLGRPGDVVEEYLRRGLKVIHLRPVQPFGFADKAWQKTSYGPDEFLSFYREVLVDLIERNRRGVEIQEKTASLFLARMLTTEDTNYMDLRSPCGAGIGQMAYNHDGRVYTCDEARMVGAMGDDLFCIGNVWEDDYGRIIGHEGVRALCMASCVEGLPGCADCAYAPYCGVCPVYSYVTQGHLVGAQPSCDRCAVQKGILDLLFRTLEEGGAETERILRRWTINRDRSSVYRRRQ